LTSILIERGKKGGPLSGCLDPAEEARCQTETRTMKRGGGGAAPCSSSVIGRGLIVSYFFTRDRKNERERRTPVFILSKKCRIGCQSLGGRGW